MEVKRDDEALSVAVARQVGQSHRQGFGTPSTYSSGDNAATLDSRIVRKIDLRLCTIAGLLCALDLIDSGIMSSASATSMPADLGLTGDRYSTAIWIVILAQVLFKLPATIIMRFVGPPIFFTVTTVLFGLITLCMGYVTDWRQMIALRFLMGLAMSGIYPGLAYLISAWYTRKEQQLRFAYLQSGQVIVVATGSIVNYGLDLLDMSHGLRGWQWMFIVQGAITMFLGLLTFLWIPGFPEKATETLWFLTKDEADQVLTAIDEDRQDAGPPEPFNWAAILRPFQDIKLYAFSVLFFLQNVVSTALSYFIPTILKGMGFTSADSILLYAPPYYYSVVPVIITSVIADRFAIRGPMIVFNALCLIAGMSMLGFPSNVAVRYVGVMLATGAYVSNWAAMNAWQMNNVTGQWKRATVAAAVSGCNALGGIAGSYIFKSSEAPWYPTAIWISIGSHILIIAVVAACGWLFWKANRRARNGKEVIEGVEGFNYIY
ncbi:putative MFS transporter [Cryphonectria parasitica EP155]|uniref:MFS transporter n=1 Tax=Cryphonectria parasitica (strain ATCC 38755 / EP155) TaxID=660469 RepID=A0A9P5CKW7_CRYP1|nr:putative MFS transporter [Cryphonectria parasitica EP155]KAF3761597.1 putative MFS transporter [Cryphonectria parasitica EP155]